MVAASRRRVSVGSGPEGPRTQSASVVSRQLGTATRTPSPRASELQHGILPTPMAFLWVRGPSGPLPPKAARSRAGRRPAPLPRGDPRRCGYGRRFAAACLCRKRAGRPAHPERLRRVEAARYCNPHPVVAGIGTAAGILPTPMAVLWVRGPSGPLPPKAARKARRPKAGSFGGSLGARAFWPAAAEGGQESAPAEGRLLCLGAIRGAVAMVAASRRRVSVGSGPEGPRTQSASVVSRQLGTATRTPSPRASELQQGIPPTPMAVLWVRGPSGPLPPKAARKPRRPKAGSFVSGRSAALWLWSPLRGGVSLSEAGRKARAPRAPPSCRGSSVLQPAPRRRGHRNCSTASCPHRWRFSGCAGLLARCRRRRPGKRAGRRPAPLPRGDPRRCGYGRRFAAACLCRKRAGRPAHPERLRRVEAARYCNPHPVAAGIGTAAASRPHRWRFSGCAGLLARCRRRRPGKRAGRRPAPLSQSASVVSRQLGTATRTPSPRASELQHGIPPTPMAVLWVRGPSGPLPPKAARKARRPKAGSL